ncbi:MAG: M23 family metallopeptidase [Verrucomicrobiales bacterium]|nr:M23 family metallopeptidase [Verrucomicrobiales bacterium]
MILRLLRRWPGIALLSLVSAVAGAESFRFPTGNQALLEAGGEVRFFQGTSGKPWNSGQFGCVRSEGHQFHEGVDIQALQRDARGEPIDAVNASAAGTVAYVNARSSLSNYGNYVVLRHQIDGMEVYTLYAHLREIRAGLKAGDGVAAGERIGTLGRTSNTRQPITKDRAHVHFEINLVVNDRYIDWHRAHLKGMRNDHGNFNGRNLLGLDPAEVFREQARLGPAFRLTEFIRSRPVMARVAVKDTSIPWVKRYPQLRVANPVADREGVAGYELGLSFNGMPVRVTPRAASELKGTAKVRLVDVNVAEWQGHPCGKLVARRGDGWVLTPHGTDVVDLIAY